MGHGVGRTWSCSPRAFPTGFHRLIAKYKDKTSALRTFTVTAAEHFDGFDDAPLGTVLRLQRPFFSLTAAGQSDVGASRYARVKVLENSNEFPGAQGHILGMEVSGGTADAFGLSLIVNFSRTCSQVSFLAHVVYNATSKGQAYVSVTIDNEAFAEIEDFAEWPNGATRKVTFSPKSGRISRLHFALQSPANISSSIKLYIDDVTMPD